MDAQLKRGLLEVCVLASLLREDSYGYRIIRDVSPYVELSESTLYPILRRLEAAKLLTVPRRAAQRPPAEVLPHHGVGPPAGAGVSGGMAVGNDRIRLYRGGAAR